PLDGHEDFHGISFLSKLCGARLACVYVNVKLVASDPNPRILSFALAVAACKVKSDRIPLYLQTLGR
ncbi:MAG: hypothetical protein KDD90_11320, partial [Sphingomonadaceae bacterium]|nr:hypothetical protein [Sphingomonadaceae bacterium]